MQGSLPLNPAGLPGVDPYVAWNTAVSFATNTNWQAYGGESTMSHLAQMAALTVQNFVSAATGMAVLVGAHPRLRRVGPRSGSAASGWTSPGSRCTLLLPLSAVLALVLVWQGVSADVRGRDAVAAPLARAATGGPRP